MDETTIKIKFQGYWRDAKKESIPAKSGLYCVYKCTHNVRDKNLSIHNLIYIGEAENVRNRVAQHEKYSEWHRSIRPGNELCFSFGIVDSKNRDRAEAAMIFKHKPSLNPEYNDSFPFDKTTMSLSGKTDLLTTHFTVHTR